MTSLGLDDKQVQRVRELDGASRERSEQGDELSALARSDRETDLEEWCEVRHLESLGDVVPALVNMGYAGAELDKLANEFTVPQFRAVIHRLSLDHEIQGLVGGIRAGTERIVEVVSALKTFTHMDRVGLQPVDVHQSLEDTLVMLRPRIGDGVTVVKDYEEGLPPVQAHAGELHQVWMSIIDNALDAIQERGSLTLRTRTESPWIVVEVEDDGPGVPTEMQSRIFDPFFTTKPPGSGTGLGLNLSHNLIVQKYQGRITVHSHPGSTRFEVCLPVE
jgi:signal transduction histidine kinase